MEEKQRRTRMATALGDIAEKRNITFREIAEACDVDVSLIYYYSKKAKMPTLKVAMCLCKVLQVTPVELAEMLGIDTEGVPRRPKKD